jgi:ABC-type Mn2+/Zn2+ transport system permease subunit
MREQMPAKSTSSRWGHGCSLGVRPEWGFAAATLATFAAWAATSATMASDWVMPIVASVFFAFAAAFGFVAYWQRSRADLTRVTYADVAGALTLIGICAAATIDPEQMVRLVETVPADGKR